MFLVVIISGYPIQGKIPTILNMNYAPSPKSLTTSNFLTVNIPEYIAKDLPSDINGIVKKGQQLIVVFVGGDITHMRVIGRY